MRIEKFGGKNMEEIRLQWGSRAFLLKAMNFYSSVAHTFYGS